LVPVSFNVNIHIFVNFYVNLIHICICIIIKHANTNFLFKHYTYNSLTVFTQIPPLFFKNKALIKRNVNTPYALKIFSTQNHQIFTSNLINIIKQSFIHLTINFFKLFFTSSQVEVPKSLLNLSILKKAVNLTYVFKFNKFLTKHGNFYKSLITLSKAWSTSLQLYSQYTNLNFNPNCFPILYPLHVTTTDTFTYQPNLTLSNFLARFVRNVQPVYTVYTYKVSKNIYKNTRGKSGKFMFLLKYVPVYKRFFIIANWLIKELRVLVQRKLKNRLMQLIHQMSNAPSNMWISRLNNFSHNYVYRNCKSTLGSTYKYVKA